MDQILWDGVRYMEIHYKLTVDQHWFDLDHCRLSLDRAEIIAVYNWSVANNHWSFVDKYRLALYQYRLCKKKLDQHWLSIDYGCLTKT